MAMAAGVRSPSSYTGCQLHSWAAPHYRSMRSTSSMVYRMCSAAKLGATCSSCRSSQCSTGCGLMRIKVSAWSAARLHGQAHAPACRLLTACGALPHDHAAAHQPQAAADASQPLGQLQGGWALNKQRARHRKQARQLLPTMPASQGSSRSATATISSSGSSSSSTMVQVEDESQYGFDFDSGVFDFDSSAAPQSPVHPLLTAPLPPHSFPDTFSAEPDPHPHHSHSQSQPVAPAGGTALSAGADGSVGSAPSVPAPGSSKQDGVYPAGSSRSSTTRSGAGRRQRTPLFPALADDDACAATQPPSQPPPASNSQAAAQRNVAATGQAAVQAAEGAGEGVGGTKDDFEAQLDALFGPVGRPAVQPAVQRTRPSRSRGGARGQLGAGRATMGAGSTVIAGGVDRTADAAQPSSTTSSTGMPGSTGSSAPMPDRTVTSARSLSGTFSRTTQQQSDIIRLDEYEDDDSYGRWFSGDQVADASKPWWQLQWEAASRAAPAHVTRMGGKLSPLRDGGAAFEGAGSRGTTLFVKGLDGRAPEDLTRAALAAAFEGLGRVVQVRLPSVVHPVSGSRELRGIAYVVFSTPDEKAAASELQGICVLGRLLYVDADPDGQAMPATGRPAVSGRQQPARAQLLDADPGPAPNRRARRAASAMTVRAGGGGSAAETAGRSAIGVETEGDDEVQGEEVSSSVQQAVKPVPAARQARASRHRAAQAHAPATAATAAAATAATSPSPTQDAAPGAPSQPAPKRKGKYLA